MSKQKGAHAPIELGGGGARRSKRKNAKKYRPNACAGHKQNPPNPGEKIKDIIRTTRAGKKKHAKIFSQK